MEPFDLVSLASRRDPEAQVLLEEGVREADAATLSAALAESATHRCTATLADAIRHFSSDVHNRAAAMELFYMLHTRHVQFSGEYRKLIQAMSAVHDDVVGLFTNEGVGGV